MCMITESRYDKKYAAAGVVAGRRIWFADKAKTPYGGQRRVLAQPRLDTGRIRSLNVSWNMAEV